MQASVPRVYTDLMRFFRWRLLPPSPPWVNEVPMGKKSQQKNLETHAANGVEVVTFGSVKL